MPSVLSLLVTGGAGLAMAAGALVAWRATGPRGAPFDPTSPGRLFVLFFLATTGLGTLVITASGEATGAGAVVAAGGLVAFAIGAWLGAERWGVQPPLGPPVDEGRIRPATLFLLAAVGVAGYGLIAVRSGIPFLTPDAQASRAAYTGVVFDLFRWLVPPVSLVAVAFALARPTARRWVAAVVALAAAGGILALTASRALPLELAIEALLLAWWAGHRLSRRTWLVLGTLALAFFVGIQLLRVGSKGGFSGPADVGEFAVGRTFDRVVLIQARTLELVTVDIPSPEPYFLGSTYVRWLAPLRGETSPEALGTWLFERLYPGQPAGFATPGLLGELWANGGAILAMVGMAILGFLVQALGRLIGRFDHGAADRVLATLLVVAVARTYATSLNGFLLTAAVVVGWRIAVTAPQLPGWLTPAIPGRRRPAAGPAEAGGAASDEVTPPGR